MRQTIDIEKELAETEAVLERLFALRILWATQCIKCGIIFDDYKQAILHTQHCRLKP